MRSASKTLGAERRGRTSTPPAGARSARARRLGEILPSKAIVARIAKLPARPIASATPPTSPADRSGQESPHLARQLLETLGEHQPRFRPT